MALLSGLMRTAAITGRSDRIDAWFADRQGARWTERTVQAAFPARAARSAPRRRAADPAETLRKLQDMRASGILTDSELKQLRTRLGA